MEIETKSLCEEQIGSAEEKNPEKKKAGKFLVKSIICLVLVALFVAYVYLLIYTFKNDGADWLRKIA